MRRVGKYEKMRAKALMQTYITSLLCLVLCVGMFLGTSYAWFTSEVISEENQIAAEDTEVYSYWGIPVMKKGIEQQAMRITQKPYWIDENGEKVEYDDYIWLGEEQIVMEPATEKEAQRWVDFILSVDQKANFNFEDAMEIISEEAEGYFSGDRKIEDVMSNTQSRMSIFTSVNN